uniref:Uncharacterized protein n=1 Tax=Anguilla anguilla TaxID=7936 RepID=A0A0E9X0E7_ANGAN
MCMTHGFRFHWGRGISILLDIKSIHHIEIFFLDISLTCTRLYHDKSSYPQYICLIFSYFPERRNVRLFLSDQSQLWDNHNRSFAQSVFAV